MDQSTVIVRPDLYLDACHKEVMHRGCRFHREIHLDGLNLSTSTFFDLLPEQVRGFVNERYNKLLSEDKMAIAVKGGMLSDWVRGEIIPVDGMDTSVFLNPVVYAKAYGQVIAELETPEKYSRCGPFQNEECALKVAEWCELRDMGRWAQVCKTWKQFSEQNAIWHRFFKEKKIPLVEPGEESNFKKELEVLLSKTVGKISEELFGEMIGEIPHISRECFNKCFEPDPFEPNAQMGNTFHFVVIPAGFKRKSHEKFSYIVDEKGLLQETTNTDELGKALEIPNGIYNLKTLIRLPLDQTKEGYSLSASDEKIFEQYNVCSKKTHVVFMRKRTAGVMGQCKIYPELEKEARHLGFRGASIGERIFSNAVSLLTTNTCPDKTLTGYPMTSDTILEDQRATLFSVWNDLFIELKHINAVRPYRGIVPCISAEVAAKPLDPS